MTAKNKITIDLHLLGATSKDIKARLEMAKQTVYDILSQYKKFGCIERKLGSAKKKTVRTSRLIRAAKSRFSAIHPNP